MSVRNHIRFFFSICLGFCISWIQLIERFVNISLAGALLKETAKFLELPFYRSGEHFISMYIFLPIRSTIDEFMEKFSFDTVREALTKGESNKVFLKMPKMHLVGEHMLGDVCYAL